MEMVVCYSRPMLPNGTARSCATEHADADCSAGLTAWQGQDVSVTQSFSNPSPYYALHSTAVPDELQVAGTCIRATLKSLD